MPPFYTTLNKLSPKNTSSVIKVRIIRLYCLHAKGGKKDVNSIECIIHDREGTRIHLTVNRKEMATLGSKFKEGCVYQIRNFWVKRNDMKYKTTDNQHRIVLFSLSEVSEIFDDRFPCHIFSFKSFEEISAIEDIHGQSLFDVIGVIVGSSTKNQENAKLIELELEDENHNTMYCTLWEDYLDSFIKMVDDKGKKVPIVIVQFCKLSTFKGEMRTCTSYNVSKILLNYDIPEINNLRQRIVGDESFIRPVSFSLVPTVKEENEFENGSVCVKMIEELFCCEDGQYWICGKIITVDCNLEWFYMACKKCTRKVSKIKNRFYCGTCKKYEGSANQRFMLTVGVVDATSNASLLLWDKECVALLGKKVSEISLDDHEVAHLDIVPREIVRSLIGQVVMFKIKLRNESEFVKDHPYSVIKIYYSDDVVKKYYSNVEDEEEAFNLVENDEDAYLEQCESLSQISQLPILNDNDIAEVDLTTPNGAVIPICAQNELVCNRLLQNCIEEEEKGMYEKENKNWGGDDSIKRCLEDEFEDVQAQKKIKMIVKQEKDC